jgi:hypothetical protein
MIVKEESLSSAFPLIIAGAQADRIHMAPVGLGLWVDIRISVDLGGGGLKDPGLYPLGQSETIDRPDHGGLHGLDGVILVVRGRSRTGEVIDAVDLELKRVDDIMTNELEAGIVNKMLDVRLATGEEIIKADHFVPLLDQTVAEVGTKESGSAGDECAHG